MKKIPVGDAYAFLEPILQSYEYQSKMPAVIINPGGAYFYTSHREAYPVAQHFLAQGFQVFILHYSTMAGKRMSDDPGLDYESARLNIEDYILSSSEQAALFPNPLLELAEAVKHLKEYPERYKIDPQAIYLLGFSAGAHLTALYSSYFRETWLKKHLQWDDLSVKGQILAYGYYDLLSFNKDQMEEKFYQSMMKATFNQLQVKTSVLKKYSPIHHLHPEIPPTFIWHTLEDSLIPIKQALDYAQKLDDLSLDWEMHLFRQGDHGLASADHVSDSPNSAVHTWLDLVFNWIEALQKEET